MSFYLITYFLFCVTVTGAFLYRGRGGNLIDLPRPVEQILFCMIFGVVMQSFGVSLLWQVVAFSLAVAGCSTGHGQYFLDLAVKPVSPERLDFILRPIFGKDPRQKFYDMGWPTFVYGLSADQVREIEGEMTAYKCARLFKRCVAGIAVTGLAVTLAPGAAIALHGHVMAGVLVGFSGAFKALAYYISHQFNKGTVWAEWGYGGAQWFMATLVWLVYLGVHTP